MSTSTDLRALPGVKAADVAGAHNADPRVHRIDAPDREAAARVYRKAHRLVAQALFEAVLGA